MPRYTIGLDLGQAQDFSAMVIVEESDDRARHDVREIKRWPLGTAYPAIVADIKALMATPLLQDPALVADATGCGRPVIDLFAASDVRVTGVMITAGGQANRDEHGYWLVPKRDLVSTVQIGLQSETLKIARSLPEAPVLTQELLNFQAKITTAANDTYGAWRDGSHDDIVLALAIALWHTRQHQPPVIVAPVGITRISPWNDGGRWI
jgi:hypothetical protein